MSNWDYTCSATCTNSLELPKTLGRKLFLTLICNVRSSTSSNHRARFDAASTGKSTWTRSPTPSSSPSLPPPSPPSSSPTAIASTPSRSSHLSLATLFSPSALRFHHQWHHHVAPWTTLLTTTNPDVKPTNPNHKTYRETHSKSRANPSVISTTTSSWNPTNVISVAIAAVKPDEPHHELITNPIVKPPMKSNYEPNCETQWIPLNKIDFAFLAFIFIFVVTIVVVWRFLVGFWIFFVEICSNWCFCFVWCFVVKIWLVLFYSFI